MLKQILLTALAASLLLQPASTQAATLASRLKGYVLLQVQSHGEAWYVRPTDLKRYYMKDGPAAYQVMRQFGLGITTADLTRLLAGDAALKTRLLGQIVLQVELHGEAYYICPGNRNVIYIKDGPAAYEIMRGCSLGVTNSDLALIPMGDLPGSTPAPAPAPDASGVAYETRTIQTQNGTFSIRLASFDTASFSMITDTADTSDCENNCAAKSLEAYVQENAAAIGIHGSYFCPPDYAPCAGKINTFLSPVYNSEAGVMRNQAKLPWHNGPLMAQAENGTMFYYHRSSEFGNSVADFESRTGLKLKAAIANYPSLMENGSVVVESEPIETAQLSKGTRGGIGYNGSKTFLVIASSASVKDLAYIFQALGATHAMNLDGGATAALYSGGYKFGPNRLLTNVILFKKR